MLTYKPLEMGKYYFVHTKPTALAGITKCTKNILY